MSLVMGITHLRLFARPGDWDTARTFYERALGLSVHFSDPENGVVMFSVGELKLLLERVDDEQEANDLVARFAGISFRVSDITRTCAELTGSGAVITGQPAVQPWGDVLAHVRDPAGNVITLIEFGEKAQV
jgi:lactoylglutathione lyase